MIRDRSEPRGQLSTLWRGLNVQKNVIGALIMRELHTRYGRENVGYLWMILEPMTLAVAVALLHAGQKMHFGTDIRTVPFAVLGYCIFILFRQMFLRAEGALEANLPLLYHRMVTVFDILFSRALLEAAGTTSTLMILILFCYVLGLGDLPARPLDLMMSLLLMAWLSWALSMIVCASTHENRLVAKFVHPASYILMPLSGAFFMVKWIPEPYRTWVAWSPMTQIFELARYGQFESADLKYVNIPYIAGWCLILTFIGLVSIDIIRKHVHLR